MVSQYALEDQTNIAWGKRCCQELDAVAFVQVVVLLRMFELKRNSTVHIACLEPINQEGIVVIGAITNASAASIHSIHDLCHGCLLSFLLKPLRGLW